MPRRRFHCMYRKYPHLYTFLKESHREIYSRSKQHALRCLHPQNTLRQMYPNRKSKMQWNETRNTPFYLIAVQYNWIQHIHTMYRFVSRKKSRFLFLSLVIFSFVVRLDENFREKCEKLCTFDTWNVFVCFLLWIQVDFLFFDFLQVSMRHAAVISFCFTYFYVFSFFFLGSV